MEMNVKEIRKNLGLSQTEFANALGVSIPIILKAEKTNKVSMKLFNKINIIWEEYNEQQNAIC